MAPLSEKDLVEAAKYQALVSLLHCAEEIVDTIEEAEISLACAKTNIAILEFIRESWPIEFNFSDTPPSHHVFPDDSCEPCNCYETCMELLHEAGDEVCEQGEVCDQSEVTTPTLRAMIDMRECNESMKRLAELAAQEYWGREDSASVLEIAAKTHLYVNELLRLDTKCDRRNRSLPPPPEDPCLFDDVPWIYVIGDFAFAKN